jgi:LacI family transcriptional regulator
VGGYENPQDAGMQARRVQGFRDAFAAADLEPDTALMFGEVHMPGIAEGLRAFQRLRDAGKHFTAVVCAHDILALGILEAAEQAGLHVPEDLSVTGFDGTTGTGYGSSSTLTTVYFDRVAMGRLAVRLLHEIADDPSLPPRHCQMAVQLLARATSAPPRTP